MNDEFVMWLETFEVDGWLKTMPLYQQKMTETMFDKLGDYEMVAQEWLVVKNSSTAPFGSSEPHLPLLEKILDEIELFFRGDSKYQNEIRSLLADKNIIQYSIVAAISQAIAGTVGTASVFISPVIGITLFTITKMGINAWLKSREERECKK